MFGHWVPRHELDAECERRIRAEAEATALRGQVSELLKLVGELVERGKASPPTPGFGVPPGIAGPAVSAAEIWRIPAVGRRGVRERNAAAREAELREEEATTTNTMADRRTRLTAAEQELLDRQIPR